LIPPTPSIRILLIDDEYDNLVTVQDFLHSIPHTHYTITWASSYQDGLHQLIHGQYDVCLLDYDLGDDTGLAILKQAALHHFNVPIILLTGRGSYAIDQEALRSGAMDYLDKSKLRADQLERSIRYTLNQYQSNRELQRSEKRFRSLVENGYDVITELNQHGIIQYISPSVERVLGYAPCELVGRSWVELIPSPASHEDFLNGFSDSIGFYSKHFVRHADGTTLWFESIGKNMLEDPLMHAYILNSRDITQNVLAIQQEERQRLAHDLHDAVSQTLFSASLMAESLSRIVSPNLSPSLEDGLKQLTKLTRGALAEMRTLLTEMRPQSMIETELPILATHLIRSAQGRSNLNIELIVEGEPSLLPPEQQECVYRILQESLNNIIKHAHAEHAQIRFAFMPDRLELTIIDDGCGFDLQAQHGDRMGLQIMKERSHKHHNHLTIDSAPHQGTRITLMVGR